MSTNQGYSLYRKVILIPAESPGGTIPEQCRAARRSRRILDESREERVGTFPVMASAIRELLQYRCTAKRNPGNTLTCTIYYVPGATRIWFARDEMRKEPRKEP